MYLQFREYDISGPSLRIHHSNANFFIQDWFSNKNFGEKSMYNTIHSSDNMHIRGVWGSSNQITKHER